ncbi:MAG: acyl-CoA thioesterase [Planctomycetes bacterium]|nr:acyl-CoA thioesterase [Planctomycetota bacterium]
MQRRDVILRFLAEPTDMNFGGKVHGGAVMKWIDQTGYACAAGWCGSYCVTVYVGGIRFAKPIAIGSLVELRAQVIYTGRTSMHVAVDVSAADPRHSAYSATTHCIIVFMAIDEAGRPVVVPPWVPVEPHDRALEAYAKRLMDLRKGIEVEMERYRPDSGPDDHGSHGAPPPG